VSLRDFNPAGADEGGEIGELHDPETHRIPPAVAASGENGPKSADEKVGTRWPSTWGPAADIPFSKSSGQRKTPWDDQSGERLCRGGQAILRFWWPIREKLKECWDGPPSAIWVTWSRARGYGCRKLEGRTSAVVDALKDVAAKHPRLRRTTRNRPSQRP